MDEQFDSNIYKTAPERLLENLKDNFKGNYKAYFFGDPFAIPQSQLPCIIVDLDDERSELGPTGFDRLHQTIIVKVVHNKRDDFGGDTETSLTKRKLMLAMSARDATTKQYVPESVMGIVRKFYTLSNEIELQDPGEIKYGIVNRNFAAEADQNSLTAEAQLTLTTSQLIQVDNRA